MTNRYTFDSKNERLQCVKISNKPRSLNNMNFYRIIFFYFSHFSKQMVKNSNKNSKTDTEKLVHHPNHHVSLKFEYFSN